ncbi:hypothetical protein vseg_001211 [Gypsophila vaccaria]
MKNLTASNEALLIDVSNPQLICAFNACFADAFGKCWVHENSTTLAWCVRFFTGTESPSETFFNPPTLDDLDV